MIKPDKIGVGNVITKLGFELDDFKRVHNTERVFQLEFENTGLFFRFEMNSDKQYIFSKSINNLDRTVKEFRDHWITAKDVIQQFENWIKKEVANYIAERTAIDPWDQFENESTSLFFDNATLTEEEIKTTESILDKFKDEVLSKIHIDQSKIDALIKEVQELKEDLKTQKKKKLSWQIIGFAIQASKFIPEEYRQQVIDFSRDAVGHLFKIEPPTLPL